MPAPAAPGAEVGLRPLPYQFEFVFVDDGSTDPTAQILSRLRAADDRVRYLRLSRNFGHQSALSAGLAHSSGDAVIMMDGDLQHPPQLIPTLLDRWRDGYDIVSTLRLETEDIPPSKQFFSAMFYRVFNYLSTVRIEAGNADFRLMSRAAVDALNVLPERHRFLRGLIPWLGFPRTQVEFKAPARWAGRSKYTLLKNIRFALEGLTAFNFYPLRIVAAAGGLVASFSLVASLACLVAYFRNGELGAAWTAMALFTTFLGGIELLALGVLGRIPRTGPRAGQGEALLYHPRLGRIHLPRAAVPVPGHPGAPCDANRVAGRGRTSPRKHAGSADALSMKRRGPSDGSPAGEIDMIDGNSTGVAGGPRAREGCRGRAGMILLAVLPLLLIGGGYYRNILMRRGDWPVSGDAAFYSYQLARMGELGGRWWKLGRTSSSAPPTSRNSASTPACSKASTCSWSRH